MIDLVAPAEGTLALPLRLLREAYGPRIEIRRAPDEQPLMEVRIGLEKSALPLVRHALQKRGANASEEYVGAHYCVLRFGIGTSQRTSRAARSGRSCLRSLCAAA